jgi:hypothetical protein
MPVVYAKQHFGIKMIIRNFFLLKNTYIYMHLIYIHFYYILLIEIYFYFLIPFKLNK